MATVFLLFNLMMAVYLYTIYTSGLAVLYTDRKKLIMVEKDTIKQSWFLQLLK